MNVGFIGLGKLGLPCALAVESRGHKVVGYDPSEQVKDIIDTKKLQYEEIWAQDHLDKSKIEITVRQQDGGHKINIDQKGSVVPEIHTDETTFNNTIDIIIK